MKREATVSKGICEIKSMDNHLLLMANVYDFDIKQNDLTIHAIEGQPLRNVEYGLPVKIIIRRNGGFIALGGFIYYTCAEVWKITNLTQFQNAERRGFFRVQASASVSIQEYKEEVEISKELQENSLKEASTEMFWAELIDISLSGLKFSSKALFENDTKLELSNLSLVENSPTLSFSCSVIDKTPCTSEKYIYRCKIENILDITSDNLCKAIFALERESIKKRRSSY